VEAAPPDVETASAGYARRFQGAVGAWFLAVQARTVLELLRSWPGARVVDVGGGHGQLAELLAAAGYDVTVFASVGAYVERIRQAAAAGRIRLEMGDLLQPRWSERSFDVALAFRLLPHVEPWPVLVAQLCRLARHAVIVDYPTARSLNAAAGLFFGLKKGVEGNTRPFRVFGDGELASAFAANGWSVAARRPQFLFPMALHRALSAVHLSQALEACARGTGLTRAFGSPVVLRAEPHGHAA
jgi:2-polyprenyl-3-methyl-5-hydroxy-6-metoxy-1,4-benzoquinol methylase